MNRPRQVLIRCPLNRVQSTSPIPPTQLVPCRVVPFDILRQPIKPAVVSMRTAVLALLAPILVMYLVVRVVPTFLRLRFPIPSTIFEGAPRARRLKGELRAILTPRVFPSSVPTR